MLLQSRIKWAETNSSLSKPQWLRPRFALRCWKQTFPLHCHHTSHANTPTGVLYCSLCSLCMCWKEYTLVCGGYSVSNRLVSQAKAVSSTGPRSQKGAWKYNQFDFAVGRPCALLFVRWNVLFAEHPFTKSFECNIKQYKEYHDLPIPNVLQRNNTAKDIVGVSEVDRTWMSDFTKIHLTQYKSSNLNLDTPSLEHHKGNRRREMSIWALCKNTQG